MLACYLNNMFNFIIVESRNEFGNQKQYPN